ncbi:unnamed protein product, partial [Vitis vinifera]|uniref:Uncharacterized protein n=1 Tax=Vitis vinifera TaxID=29760 RepID=D7SRV8_VITVI
MCGEGIVYACLLGRRSIWGFFQDSPC